MEEEGYDRNKEPLPEPSVFGQAAAKKRRQERQWLTASLMMDIAGNAMTLPVLLAIAQSTLCAIEFREEKIAVTDKDTEQALQALALFS